MSLLNSEGATKLPLQFLWYSLDPQVLGTQQHIVTDSIPNVSMFPVIINFLHPYTLLLIVLVLFARLFSCALQRLRPFHFEFPRPRLRLVLDLLILLRNQIVGAGRASPASPRSRTRVRRLAAVGPVARSGSVSSSRVGQCSSRTAASSTGIGSGVGVGRDGSPGVPARA